MTCYIPPFVVCFCFFVFCLFLFCFVLLLFLFVFFFFLGGGWLLFFVGVFLCGGGG